jgi:hypothetical protein
MKKHPHLLILAIFALLITGCAAQTVTFSWNVPTQGSPTGYKLYVSPPGTTNWNVLATVATTNHSVPFTATAWGERYFVTATKGTQESPPSEVITNSIPRSPENLRMNHTIALPH